MADEAPTAQAESHEARVARIEAHRAKHAAEDLGRLRTDGVLKMLRDAGVDQKTIESVETVLGRSLAPAGDFYRCFHCRQAFTAAQARVHFGNREERMPPVCQEVTDRDLLMVVTALFDNIDLTGTSELHQIVWWNDRLLTGPTLREMRTRCGYDDVEKPYGGDRR